MRDGSASIKRRSIEESRERKKTTQPTNSCKELKSLRPRSEWVKDVHICHFFLNYTDFPSFSFTYLLLKNWDVIDIEQCISFRWMKLCFNICMYCKMITTISLVNVHHHIQFINLLLYCDEPFKIFSQQLSDIQHSSVTATQVFLISTVK